VLIFAGLICAGKFLPLKDYFVAALNWVQSLGYWGPVVVVLFYIVACVLFLPGSALTLGTGFLFKLFWGTVTVSIGATLGACAAFWVGRTVARGWIAKKVAGNAKFAAIDEAVGREGFKIVLLTRLSPIFPFNLLNYAFGLTRVRFRSYALASWIGMLPGTIMYVYIGSGLRSLADAAAGNAQPPPAQRIFFWIGLIVAVGVAVLVTRIARRALKEVAPGGAQGGEEPHG
jgi:uncharacterized membrane protein YdjX (TVP38/TMEM64 family)